jgi:hypothetical protein
MSTQEILRILIAERDKLSAAIAALQGSAGNGHWRSKPRARQATAEQRAAASARMKKAWRTRKARAAKAA